MKTKSIATLMFVMLVTTVWGGEPLKIEITGPKSTVLPGEPLSLAVRIANCSATSIVFRGEKPEDGVGVETELFDRQGTKILCPGGPSSVVIQMPGKPVTSVLGPSQSVTLREEYPGGLAYCVLAAVPPGEYSLRVKVYKWDLKCSGKNALLASDEIRFVILEPAGENAAFLKEIVEALEKAGENDIHRARPSTRPLEWLEVLTPVGFRDIHSRICAMHPTSSYAVYALAQFYGLKGYTPPLDEERVRAHLAKLQKTGRDDLADRTRHFATGPDGKELKDAQGKVITITQEEWLRKSIEQAEQICAGHPELSITEHIRYNVIGFYLVDLLQYGEAAKVFEKLAATASDPQIKANSEKMMQLLKEAGLVTK